MQFNVGDEIIKAQAGDCVFLPVQVLHCFEVLGNKAEVLMWMNPAGLEEWFWDNSVPALNMQPLPPVQGPPPPAIVKHFVQSPGNYGVTMQEEMAINH